jgi:hypothetical protein
MDARDLEVRCSGCGAGFAIGTRRCIHCGRDLGAPRAPTLPGATDAEPDADPRATQKAMLTNLLSGAVMIALLAVSALMRACNND